MKLRCAGNALQSINIISRTTLRNRPHVGEVGASVVCERRCSISCTTNRNGGGEDGTTEGQRRRRRGRTEDGDDQTHEGRGRRGRGRTGTRRGQGGQGHNEGPIQWTLKRWRSYEFDVGGVGRAVASGGSVGLAWWASWVGVEGRALDRWGTTVPGRRRRLECPRRVSRDVGSYQSKVGNDVGDVGGVVASGGGIVVGVRCCN